MNLTLFNKKENLFTYFLGLFLTLCFFSFEWSGFLFQVQFFGPLGFIPEGELKFWLAYTILLVPGMILITYSFKTPITAYIDLTEKRLKSLSNKEWTFCIFLLTLLLFVVARIGHYLVLLDYPITDDEYGALLGGQILASGKWMAPFWGPIETFKHPFMYIRDGFYTSMESPGVLVTWAISELMGDPFIWHLVAATPVIPITLIVTRKLDRSWGMISALFFIFSPAVITSSMTTHAHLLTRLFFAIVLLFFVLSEERKEFKYYFWFGFMAATGISCRAYEICFLLLPFGFFWVWQLFCLFWSKDSLRSKKLPDEITALVWIFIGVLGPLLLFGFYNLHTTKNFFLDTRSLPAFKILSFPGYEDRLHSPLLNSFSMDIALRRFGENLSYNLLCLLIWFSAPIVSLFIYLGILENKLTKLLALGLFSVLTLALFHNFPGIHSIGPINYTECAVSLTLLATFGLKKLTVIANKFKLPCKELIYSVVVGTFLSAFIFSVKNLYYLNLQAKTHEAIYGFILTNLDTFWAGHPRPEGRGFPTLDERKAVVLVKLYRDYWMKMPQFKMIGSFLGEWRIPKPDLSEPILYLRDEAGKEDQLRQIFPDRDFFRLSHQDWSPNLSLDFLPPPLHTRTE